MWKLLGVKFDYKLTFNAHIDGICKKVGLKLNTLSRIALYMYFNKNGYYWMRSSCLNSIAVLWFGCVIIAQKIVK